MNVYAAILLAALLLEYGLGLAADLANLRALEPAVPPELRDVYDAERYRRAREYTRAHTRFGIVVATVDLALLLAAWFVGGFGWLDRAVRAFGLGSIGTALLYIGSLGLARIVAAIPFRWWSTFVIEERFGFNRTTPRTFWTDWLKGLGLAVVLGGPLLAAVLWLFERAGPRAWLWCWLASALYLVAVEFVAPTWIMPLFNTFTPLPEGGLREAILSYARAVGFPLQGVFLIDGSRRSTKANALFTGFGRRRRIALFDTLVATLGAEEVVAVVAHEVGHYKRRHVIIAMLTAIAQMGLMFFLLSIFLDRPGLFEAFYVETRSVYAGLVLFALLFAPMNLVLSVLLAALSRRNERAADRFAAETTGAGEPLARALGRLASDSLANLTPHPLHVALHHSHPPVLARIRALRRWQPSSR